MIKTQVPAKEATVRESDWYETSQNKRAMTRARTTASLKRNFTTQSKPEHVPVRKEILDKRLRYYTAVKVHNPNQYLSKTSKMSQAHTNYPHNPKTPA